MMRAWGHSWLWRHARAVALVALHIALVGQRLLGIHGHIWGHIASGAHVWVLRHAWTAALWWEMAGRLLRRIDLVAAVDTIFAARRGLRCVEACLDQILALSLGDERLKLGRGEGVNQSRLRHDQQQNLGACQDGQFVGLLHDTRLALGKGDVAARLVADELDLNLATLAAALLVIVVVVVGSWARSLDAAALVRVAIADRVRVVELRGRRLVVLVGDVGHVERLRLQLRQQL